MSCRETHSTPDFIGIGAQKAGTTWLHRNLQAHPEIWMPTEKELHYFDEKIKAEAVMALPHTVMEG